MIIALDKPFSLGDLSTDTYPHVYVTNFAINGPAATATVAVEVGRMDISGQWQPSPINTVSQLTVTGQDLIPFFMAHPVNLEQSLWDQVEAVIYAHVQRNLPRYAGSIVANDGSNPGATTPVADAPVSAEESVQNAQ